MYTRIKPPRRQSLNRNVKDVKNFVNFYPSGGFKTREVEESILKKTNILCAIFKVISQDEFLSILRNSSTYTYIYTRIYIYIYTRFSRMLIYLACKFSELNKFSISR